MREEILLWRRVDEPGHESARLVYHEPFWQLGGMAVFAADDKACRLEYSIACDAAWRTLRVDVAGWVGPRRIRFHLVANAQRVWLLDGRECPDVAGCLDVDLSFSPGFGIEPLDQVYRRVSETSYRYEAAAGTFASDFEVNAAGFVTRYPGRWEEERAPAGPV
jgi:hypothetical protein